MLFAAALWAVPTALAQQSGDRGLALPEAERGEGRMALVIGNAAYTSIPPLVNPVSDAIDVGAALEKMGFSVRRHTDQGRDEMAEAIRAFATEAVGAEVALLFYAGHGIEVRGDNYLLPTDIGQLGSTASGIEDEAIPLDDVLRALEPASLQFVVLDACRSNPFASAGPGGENTGGGPRAGGWAIPSSGVSGGTLVAYGTAPGAVADDNVAGRNGLFTEALLAELMIPGIEAAELMRRVTRRVREASRSVQSPWFSASYTLPFYFIEPERRPETGQSLMSAPLVQIEEWAQRGRAAYEKRDFAGARSLLEQAARAGHTDSQYYLGTMYMAGLGVPEAPKQAADWFELASMRGHPKAQHFLGGMYGGGFGRDRDDDRAATLYERAAEQGLVESQYRLGIVYETGRGRPEHRETALRWYFRAAFQGHAPAREALERLDAEGDNQARAFLLRLP